MSDPINLREIERKLVARYFIEPGICSHCAENWDEETGCQYRNDCPVGIALALVALVRDARPVLEQAARLLRSWSQQRQQASGKWTAQEQAAVNCACNLDALRARVRDEEA